MNDTHFELHPGDSKEHYSTAYDGSARMHRYQKSPDLPPFVHKKVSCAGNPPYRRTLTNHNRLLRIYDDAVGIKTGFTKKSGRCLVSAARRDGVTLVAVTLNAPDDWNDHSNA